MLLRIVAGNALAPVPAERASKEMLLRIVASNTLKPALKPAYFKRTV